MDFHKNCYIIASFLFFVLFCCNVSPCKGLKKLQSKNIVSFDYRLRGNSLSLEKITGGIKIDENGCKLQKQVFTNQASGQPQCVVYFDQ